MSCRISFVKAQAIIFISPLDAIIERLNKKGYKVGELTGRNMYVERNDDGRVVVKRRTDKDKKENAERVQQWCS